MFLIKLKDDSGIGKVVEVGSWMVGGIPLLVR